MYSANVMTSLKDAFAAGHRHLTCRIESATGIYPPLSNIISGYVNDLANDVLNVTFKKNVAVVLRIWSIRGISVINCGIGRWINNCEFYISGGNIHCHIVFHPSKPPTDKEILEKIDVRWHEFANRAIAAVAKKYTEVCAL
jgi:hypothetical protein